MSSIIPNLVTIARPYRRTLALGLGSTFLSVGFDQLGRGLCIPMLIYLVLLGGNMANIPFPNAHLCGFDLKQLLTQIIQQYGSYKLLLIFSLFSVLLFVLKCSLDAMLGYNMNKFANQMACDLRERLFKHFLRLSPGFFENATTGENLSRVTNDVIILQSSLGPQLAEIIRAPLTIISSLIGLFYIDWQLTLVVLCLAPGITIIISITGRVIRKLTIRMQDRLADLNSFLVERLSNIRVIQSFTMEQHETTQAHRINGNYFHAVMRSFLVSETLTPSIELSGVIGMIIGMVVGGLEVLQGKISPLTFMFFMGLAQNGGSYFKQMSRINVVRQQAEGTGARIFELLNLTPEIQDAPQAQTLPPVQGHITFDAVSFRYASGDPVLNDIAFDAAPGEVIALVGPSGSGKTTLVNLLPRFYDPTAGRILVDGQDIREVTLSSLRLQTGSVPQETVLFSGTIYDNILYGRMSASEAEVIAAAQAANALEFIDRLPEGFRTVVGERGTRLSGGQRQRVAIARALLKNPRILILDEATSALDTESEYLVQQALERLMENRTTFVIAHRLSTVQHATRILVLDRGRIIETGTHQQLLAQGGLYQRLYEMQFLSRSSEPAIV